MSKTFEWEQIAAQVDALPESERQRVKSTILDVLEQSAATDALTADLTDPEYTARVEQELATGEADVAAGRLAPATEVFDRLEAEHKTKHGL